MLIFLTSRTILSYTGDINPHRFLHVWKHSAGTYRENSSWLLPRDLPRKFAVAVCREILAWLYPARIGRKNLPWEFALAVCGGCFVNVSKSFLYAKNLFLWKQIYFCMRAKLFYLRFFVNGVSFCCCRGSYGPT